MMERTRVWPLALIALPASVAIWAGWVSLGEMCGFGIVTPLPGIWSGLHLNTAITLPVGVEAYAAFALGAALSHGTPETARRFAWWSAGAALALGMAGQVSYHLLAASGVTRAPWPVIVAVSCMPVITLGCAAMLAHLLCQPVPVAPGPVPAAPGPVPAAPPEPEPAPPEPEPVPLLARLAQLEQLPSQRSLAAEHFAGNRREAARVLELARASRNGHGGS